MAVTFSFEEALAPATFSFEEAMVDDVRSLEPPDASDPLTRVASSAAGGVNPTFTVSDDLPKSVLDKEPARPGEFDMRKASAARNALDDPRTTAPRATPGERQKSDPMVRSGESFADSLPPVRAVQKARAGAAEGGFGLLRAGADLVGADSVARFAGEAAGAAKGFQQGMGQNKPIAGFGPDSPVPYLADMAEGAGSSLLTTAAMASMFGAKAVIPLMSIQSAGQQYDAARQAGKDPWMALANAVPFGVFEAVGEKFQGMDKAAAAMGVLMRADASTAAKKTAADALLRAGVREIPGEVITYGGQTVVDLLPGVGIRQDMTVRDFLDGLRDTVIQAGMMGSVTAGAGAAAKPAQASLPGAEALARGKGFLVVERDPTPAIMSAPTVDAAIEAAAQAVSPPQASVAQPESAAAVDNIGRILQSTVAEPAPEPVGGVAEVRPALPSAAPEAIPEIASEQNAVQAALERAGTLETPTAMELALQRARGPSAPAAEPAPTSAPLPRVVERTPQMVALPQKLAEQRAAATGGEVVRIRNQSGKFAFTVIPKAADVSPSVDTARGVSAGMDGRSGDAGGSEPAGGLGDRGPGAATESGRGGDADVAVGGGAGAEPVATWFGRRGDGYLTEGDAAMAIPSRQRIAPDLSWRIERMPTGKFRLAGYPSAAVESQDASLTPQPPTAPDPSMAGAVDAAPIESTVGSEAQGSGGTTEVAATQLAPRNETVQPAQVTQTPPLSGASTSAPAESVTSGTAKPTERERIAAMTRKSQQRKDKLTPNPFKTFLIRNGIALRLAKEFAPGTKERLAMSRTFRNGGLELDALAERAAEYGYIRSRDDTDELYDLIAKAASGERVAPLYGQDAEAELAALVDRQREMEQDAAEAVGELSDESVLALEENDDSIPWDTVSNVSEAEAMRALGFSEQEISDATTARQVRAQEAGAGNREPEQAAGRQAQGNRAGRSEEAPDEGLTAPTPADVIAQQERAAQGEREETQRKKDEQARAKADAERGEFRLSGSDRPADANPDQTPLFSRDTKEPVASRKDVVGKQSAAPAGDSSGTDANTGLPLNADGTVTVYHHTSKAAADAIRRTGILKADAEPDVYVTTRQETDTGYGDTAVAIRVRPEDLQIDDEFPNGRKDFRLNVGKPGGSVKVDVVGNNEGGRSADDETEGARYAVKPPKRLYRGVTEGADGTQSGFGTFMLGRGLYSSRDKSFAKKYGNKVIEVDPTTAWPRNPLVLHNVAGGAPQAFMDWALEKSGLRNAREFNKKYPDPGEFVRSLGFDGVIAGDEVVKYPTVNESLTDDASNESPAPDSAGAKFAKGEASPSGLTPSEFTAAIAKAFGPKVAERLESKGIVVPLSDQTSLPDNVVSLVRDNGIVHGFYDPVTDKTYAVLENLSADMVKGLVLHEVGVHYGFEQMLGNEKYGQVIARLKLMGKAGNKQVVAARDKARQNAANETQVPEETLAYLIGENPEMTLVQDVIARIKAFLFRTFGIGWKYLSANDMTALARAAVLHASRADPQARQRGFDAQFSMSGDTSAESNALQSLSEVDDLFRLPKSDKDTIEGIAADTNPAIQVSKTSDVGLTQTYVLTMPDGSKARIMVRRPNPYGEQAYGLIQREGEMEVHEGRPGTNPEAVPEDMEDVYTDVSLLKEGGAGAMVYNIAATYAHNTGRIFIGDPAGLSDVAMRRRTEHMLSSALKFGTTRHLAPHPRQTEGDRKIGVPPMRWTYGDDVGNIESLVQTSLAAFDYADTNPLTFEPDTGRFIDRSGNEPDAGSLQRSVKDREGREARVGLASLKRNAILRALLPTGSGKVSERGSQLLERLLDVAGQPDSPASGVFYSRSAVTGQQADVTQSAPDRSPWRDATGRLQFAPGVWLYDKLGDLAAPLLTKLGLKAASPELRRQLRAMKLAVQKAQETAAAVAGEAMKLSDAERAMVSDLIEQELSAGTVPPSHAVRLAAMINESMGAQTDELVRLGMLTKDSAELWRGKYLPRFYKNKLTKQVGDAWADALQQLRGKQKVMAGIKGKHLKGRGLYETVAASAVAEWESLGWEVRDQDHPKADASEINRKILGGEIAPEDTVQVWRDFTREERDKMGEIRDAGFRFVMGYMQTQRDIALGRMFEGLSNDPDMSSKRESERFNVQVPDGTVPGTGAKRYGKLAGRWVPKEVMSHLSQIDESQSEAWRMYRKALAIWKEGKTALNPVAHVNNTVSNLTMAHLAGVSYHRADKYIAAARDFATKSPRIKEAKDAGLFLGTMSDAELMNVLPEELKLLVRQQDAMATKIGRTGFNVMTFWLRRPMGWAYQAEDTFFRYLIWKDATDRGMSPEDAVDHAKRYIFAYDDLPKGARMIRDFGIPFFAYTYKAAPALLYSALTHPVRMAAPAAVLWGINAAAYAIAVGDDDDSWEQAIRKYLTDAAYREEARKKEKLEREFLPPWNRGTTALGTPKMIRLGMDEVTKLPLFIDVSRIIPGGDLFDVSPNAGGIPLPQPITPSHPLFTTAVAMIGNKDLFRGKELVDKNDTRGEATEKRLEWLWTQVSPAVAAGSYHWDRTMNAIAQASGGEIKWLPEVVADNYTGIGRDGLPVLPKYAAMQTFGIKVRPMDLEKSEAIDQSIQKRLVREIDAEMRSLRRLNNLGAVSDRTYERARELADTKKDRIREGKTVDGEDKD